MAGLFDLLRNVVAGSNGGIVDVSPAEWNSKQVKAPSLQYGPLPGEIPVGKPEQNNGIQRYVSPVNRIKPSPYRLQMVPSKPVTYEDGSSSPRLRTGINYEDGTRFAPPQLNQGTASSLQPQTNSLRRLLGQ